ncbi:MAG TPA: PAC2 family protein [Acidimicrobiales bacterium]|jgi:proteasome assembly chaperone (PAC2) family protein|nr:PAC2 family protein [Acidimicrobiales bacterium]
MVCAFEGWNDAGEAASFAAAHLHEAWQARPFAEIDSDEFFDFTEVRPETIITEDGRRRIVWPSTSFSVAKGEMGAPDIVIVRGPEPQLRWQAYIAALIELALFLKIERVVTLGAYLGEVTHGRPVPVSASTTDVDLSSFYKLEPSLYEGPTGIVGVLATAFGEVGVPTLAVWASVPCYSLPVSPKAALALVEVATRFVGREVDCTALEAETTEYEARMDEFVADDDNIAAYVARIEEMEEFAPADLSAEGLAEEIERYLRENRRS